MLLKDRPAPIFFAMATEKRLVDTRLTRFNQIITVETSEMGPTLKLLQELPNDKAILIFADSEPVGGALQ